MPSLLENLRLNISNKNEEVNIFERRVVFEPDGKKPKEVFKLAGLMHGLREGFGWNRPKDWVDFYDAKGIIEALFACLGLNEASYEPEKGNEVPSSGEIRPGFGRRQTNRDSRGTASGYCREYGFKPVYVFEVELAGLLPFSRRPKNTRGSRSSPNRRATLPLSWLMTFLVRKS